MGINFGKDFGKLTASAALNNRKATNNSNKLNEHVSRNLDSKFPISAKLSDIQGKNFDSMAFISGETPIAPPNNDTVKERQEVKKGDVVGTGYDAETGAKLRDVVVEVKKLVDGTVIVIVKQQVQREDGSWQDTGVTGEM